MYGMNKFKITEEAIHFEFLLLFFWIYVFGAFAKGKLHTKVSKFVSLFNNGKYMYHFFATLRSCLFCDPVYRDS